MVTTGSPWNTPLQNVHKLAQKAFGRKKAVSLPDVQSGVSPIHRLSLHVSLAVALFSADEQPTNT